MQIKVKVIPTFTLVIDGREEAGFVRGQSWHGMVEFKRGTDVVVVNEYPQSIFDVMFSIERAFDCIVVKGTPRVLNPAKDTEHG